MARQVFRPTGRPAFFIDVPETVKTIAKSALFLLALFLGVRGGLLFQDLRRSSRDPWREQRLAERMVKRAQVLA